MKPGAIKNNMNKTMKTLTALLIILTFGLILSQPKTVPVYDSGIRGDMCGVNQCQQFIK